MHLAAQLSSALMDARQSACLTTTGWLRMSAAVYYRSVTSSSAVNVTSRRLPGSQTGDLAEIAKVAAHRSFSR
jgi:hypothetical protein